MSIMLGLLMLAGEPQIELSERQKTVSRNPRLEPLKPKDDAPSVNLYKAGTLDYNPVLSKFPPQSIPNSKTSALGIEIAIIADGSVKNCQLMRKSVIEGDNFNWVDEKLCPDIIENGKFEFIKGFELNSDIGFHGFNIIWTKAPPVVKPFAYGSKDNGYELRIYDLNDGGCRIFDDSFNEEEKQAICVKTLASKAYKNKIKSYGPLKRSHWLITKTWLKKKPMNEDASVIHFSPSLSILDRKRERIDWPSQELEVDLLNSGDGEFQFKIDFSDNPSEFQPYYLEDVNTVLKISSDGEVVNCLPTGRANKFVIVSFKACALLKERGRFVFNDSFVDNGRSILYNYILQWPDKK